MLETLRPHDHLCLIYESKEEWRAAVVSFISIGLNRGDKCIYVVDTSTAGEISKYLIEVGVDVAASEKSGQLSILHETEAYTREGSFDPDKMIALLISETEKAIAEGYPALRVTGEMTWVLHGHPGSERLLEYEAKLNRDLFPEYPCLAICQYDRWKFDPEIIKGVIMTHPLLIRGNNIYHNFYYIPPEEFLSQKVAEVEVQRWLDNIEREHQIQGTLVRSEQEKSTILTTISELVVYQDLEHRVLWANKAAGESVGLAPEDLVGRYCYDIWQRRRLPCENCPVAQARETGKPEENQVGSPDGRFWLIRGYPVTGPDGVVSGAIEVTRDITERKRADEALRESEERYRFLVELSPEAIFVASEGKHVFANSAGLKLLGALSPNQVIGKPIMDVIHPDYREVVAKRMRMAMETGVIPPVLEEKFIRLDGTVIDVEVRGAPLVYQGKPAMQVVISDITIRKRMEESLRLSEQNFRDSIENSLLGIRIVNKDGKTLYANRAFLAMWGYSSIEELEAVPRKQRYTPESYEEHRERVEKRKRGETAPITYDISIVRGDGQIRYLSASRGKVLWNGERQFQVVYQDITERKRMEESLQLSEQNFRDSIESSPLGIRVLDKEGGKTIYANRALLGILGYSSIEELDAVPRKQRYTPEGYDEHMKMLEKRQRGEDIPLGYEVQIVRGDGQVRHVLMSRGEVLWDGGKRFQVVYQDITERKRMEQLVKENEARFRSIVETTREWIWQMDLDGKMTYNNPAFKEILGYDHEEVLGHNTLDYMHEEDRQRIEQMLQQLIPEKRGWTNLVVRWRHKDGTSRWLESNAVPILDLQGQMLGYQGADRDITERKRAEEALRESEERYRLIAENASDVIWTADMNLKMTYISPSCINLHGYTPEETLNRTLEERMTKESVDKVTNMWMESLADEAAGRVVPSRTNTFEAEIKRKDGSIVWTETIASFVRDGTGKAIGILGVTRNIDARKRAEEAVRTSEERYRLLAENIRDVIWAMDMDLHFTYVSPSVKYLGDRTAEEVMSMSLEQLLTPSSQELVLELLDKELALAKTMPPRPGRSRMVEVEVVQSDSSILWSELRMSFVRGPNGQPVGILGIMRDITEQRKIEEERRVMEQKAQLASRLASVGELAAGIAHEVNNPLTGVIGYAELLMKEDVPEHVRDGLEVIHEGAKRVVGIVRGLLTFARRSKPERTLVDINQIVESTLRLRAYELQTSNIKVTTELDPDLSITFADSGQLQQVFLNLIINAETEMRLAYGKGKLMIKTEQIDSTIRISFKDDGPGIAEENLERIFNPFFTTREVGKGTGLGLSVCHGIMNEHGGRIWAESELGNGTTFIVELPIVSDMKQLKRAKPVHKAGKAAKAKILVVDDELAVRQLLKQLLTEEGHEVETADNGKDAFEMIKSNGFSLILLDIKLPRMSGIKLYERIQSIANSPLHQVVFITGDIMGVDTEAFLARTKAPYITKPFDIEFLCSEVNRLLTRRRSTRGSSKS
jgi:PAS domain S-box-containing protein